MFHSKFKDNQTSVSGGGGGGGGGCALERKLFDFFYVGMAAILVI